MCFTRPRFEARDKRTNENSPICAIDIPTVNDILVENPKALTTRAITEHLNRMMIMSVQIKTSKWTHKKNGLIIMPMDDRNNAPKMLRTGLIWF